jgi:CheY-like chemotaxis protein
MRINAQEDSPVARQLPSHSPQQSWLASRTLQNISRMNALTALHHHETLRLPVVVVVDDDPITALTLAEILSRHGMSAVWFTEAVEAMLFMESCPVDVLLSDFSMPEINGVSLCERTHRLQPSCLLLVFTAIAREPCVRKSIAETDLPIHLGIKPLCPRKLVWSIQAMISNRAVDQDVLQGRSGN